jgi:PKD repeat protein
MGGNKIDVKQKISIALISIILLSATAFAAPTTNAIAVTKIHAAFTATHNVKTPLIVKFTCKSTGSPKFWSWNFGDKTSISKTPNPTHVYKKAGKYTVTLTVKNAKGQSSTATKVINTNSKTTNL